MSPGGNLLKLPSSGSAGVLLLVRYSIALRLEIPYFIAPLSIMR
jgi:hypothetical protein